MPRVRDVLGRSVDWTRSQMDRGSKRLWDLMTSKASVKETQGAPGGKRWQLNALPPKASPPPSPLLPSEIKYSASLVRGQAVVHAVLGLLLFVFGVIGSHRWAALTCVPSLVCGMTGVWAGVCGGLAHKIWYKNWAIKSFFVSSSAVVVLSVLALALTFYLALTASPAYDEDRFVYEDVALDRVVASDSGREQTEEIVGATFFEVHKTPPSQSLIGNIVVGLLLQLLMGLWSLVTSWRGVQAQEFTTARREELLQQELAAQASLNKKDRDAEGGVPCTVPLAAIYQLLQSHPELLQSTAERPSSRHSMDYRERVSRYLSKTCEADPISIRNASPSLCESSGTLGSTKPSPMEIATRNEMAASGKTDANKKELSDEKSPSVPTISGNDPATMSSSSNSPSQSSSPIDAPKSNEIDSDSSSSSLSRKGSVSSKGNRRTSMKSVEFKEPLSLVLGAKTFSPLSAHIIDPSELAWIRSRQRNTRSFSEVNFPSSLQRDLEYHAKFGQPGNKPPTASKKDFFKPKLIFKNDLRNLLKRPGKQRRGSLCPSQCYDEAEERNAWEEGMASFKIRLDGEVNKDPTTKIITTPEPVRSCLVSPSRRRKRKDRKPPPIPVITENGATSPAENDSCEKEVKSVELKKSSLTKNEELFKLPTADPEIPTPPKTSRNPKKRSTKFRVTAAKIDEKPTRSEPDDDSITTTPSLRDDASIATDMATGIDVPSTDSGVSSIDGSVANVSANDLSPSVSNIETRDVFASDSSSTKAPSDIHSQIDKKLSEGESSAAIVARQSTQSVPEDETNKDEFKSSVKNIPAENVCAKTEAVFKIITIVENENLPVIETSATNPACPSEVSSDDDVAVPIEMLKVNSESISREVLPLKKKESYRGQISDSPDESSKPIKHEIDSGHCKVLPNVNDDKKRNEETSSITREVPFVKSVILKNKDTTIENDAPSAKNDRVLTRETVLAEEDPISTLNIAKPAQVELSAKKSSSPVPAKQSRDVKISFRSLKDETSIPTSFGSIKCNKSFEKILGAILSRTQNSEASKPESPSEEKKLSESKHEAMAQASVTKSQITGPVDVEIVELNEKSADVKEVPPKALSIEIRPYKCTSIRDEINAAKKANRST